jgi:hypothetical protein
MARISNIPGTVSGGDCLSNAASAALASSGARIFYPTQVHQSVSSVIDSENVPASLLMADTRQVSSERHRSSSPAIACPTWRHVCFAPKSGHVRCTGSCLLWAKSGHASNLARESRDALVGQPASRLNWTFGLDFRYFGVTSRAAAGALRHERSAHPEHATGRDLNRH